MLLLGSHPRALRFTGERPRKYGTQDAKTHYAKN